MSKKKGFTFCSRPLKFLSDYLFLFSQLFSWPLSCKCVKNIILTVSFVHLVGLNYIHMMKMIPRISKTEFLDNQTQTAVISSTKGTKIFEQTIKGR